VGNIFSLSFNGFGDTAVTVHFFQFLPSQYIIPQNHNDSTVL